MERMYLVGIYFFRRQNSQNGLDEKGPEGHFLPTGYSLETPPTEEHLQHYLGGICNII